MYAKNVQLEKHWSGDARRSSSFAPYPSDLAKIVCGCDGEQLLLAVDYSEELFPKLRTPTGFIVKVKNKTQNWAIH